MISIFHVAVSGNTQANWWRLSKIIPVLFRNTDFLKSLWVSLHRRAQLQSQQTTQFNCLHSSNTCIGCWAHVSFCSSAAVLQQRHYWWRKFDFKSWRFWQDSERSSCGFMFSVNLCARMWQQICNRQKYYYDFHQCITIVTTNRCTELPN